MISSSELESFLCKATPKPGLSPCVGGLYQPSTSFGLKWILWFSEIELMSVVNVMFELSGVLLQLQGDKLTGLTQLDRIVPQNLELVSKFVETGGA